MQTAETRSMNRAVGALISYASSTGWTMRAMVLSWAGRVTQTGRAPEPLPPVKGVLW